MKIGSLCSGYGGLDMAAEAHYQAETLWMCDPDKSSSVVIDKRWNLPNLGDLKTVDWASVEPIDILTAGYPCQPFSQAGQRKGANDPRHLWPNIKEIIGTLRPRIVILENVRGHLSLGFKEVLQDLTQIGYDAKWTIVRASDVGAPHRRERLFILAEPSNPNGAPYQQLRGTNRTVPGKGEEVINRTDRQVAGPSSQTISNSNTEQLSTNRQAQRLGWRFETPSELSMRRTPNPLDQSKLNPIFVEYMMGLPEGWVTDLGFSRAQQFKLLGNGVVPQQAYEAVRRLNAFDA